jgi:hypothetical protein
MPRPPTGRVGRSAGAAEHRVERHRIARALSRTTSLTRATALACVVALSLAGAPAVAAAQQSTNSIASIRAAIDTTAGQWFAAQGRAAQLDRQIQLLGKTLAAEEQRVAAIREIAHARAVQIYEDNTQGLGSMLGNDPLETGRRAALIAQANSEGQQAIDALNASVADLTARRDQLRTARDDLTRTLRDLTGRRKALDAQLTTLQLRSAPAAERTVLAAEIRRAAQIAPNEATTRSAPATAPTLATEAQLADITSAAPAPPSDTNAVSPHHDHPFLVCTRARESSGDYRVVSPSGYYGAYQFAPTTWNATASHAGRLELLGVLASAASEYDQDEMAWSLYQWQGAAPWGGRC